MIQDAPITSKGGVSTNESFCTPVVYTGAVCREYLQAQQVCLTGVGDNDIFIPMREPQQELETQAMQFLADLQLLTPSENCSEAIVPFICFSIFGLCNSCTRELYLPSLKDCNVLMNMCGPEFELAMSLNTIFSTLQVPRCDLFLNSTLICTGMYYTHACMHVLICCMPCMKFLSWYDRVYGVKSDSNIGNTTDESPASGEAEMSRPNVTPVLVCSDGFYDAGGACQPKCGEWEGSPHTAIVITDVVIVFQAVAYIVSAAVVLVLSCIQHQRMYVTSQPITDAIYLHTVYFHSSQFFIGSNFQQYLLSMKC